MTSFGTLLIRQNPHRQTLKLFQSSLQATPISFEKSKPSWLPVTAVLRWPLKLSMVCSLFFQWRFICLRWISNFWSSSRASRHHSRSSHCQMQGSCWKGSENLFSFPANYCKANRPNSLEQLAWLKIQPFASKPSTDYLDLTSKTSWLISVTKVRYMLSISNPLLMAIGDRS